MSYEEFVSGMELELKSLVSDNLLVSVQKTLKNNGDVVSVCLRRISIYPQPFIWKNFMKSINMGLICIH